MIRNQIKFKNKSNHSVFSAKKLLLVGLVILAVVMVIWALYLKSTPSDSASLKGNTNTIQSPDEAKQAADAKKKLAESQSTTKQADTSQIQTTDNSKSIEMSARTETNNSVTIFTKLYGYSDGECQLSVSANGNNTSQTANVIYQSDFSSCAGFSVPKSDLGSGTWKISLTVVSEGKSSTKIITYETK